MVDKFILRWSVYLDLLYTLIDKVKGSEKKYEFVWGPPRGGMIPAVVFSHCLDLKLLIAVPPLIEPLGERDRYKKSLLIVDDCVDTGTTLNSVRDFDIATIFKKPWSPFTPKYWVKETSKWIVFPYEEPDLSL